MDIQFEQWFTGFCEGDGHLRIVNGRYPKILIGQSEREPLDYVVSHFETRLPIYHSSQYQLIALGRKCVPLLEVLARHVVCKHFLEKLNVLLDLVGLPLTVLHEPSLDWLVGFWDAEGTSDRTPAISIVQKEQGVIEAIGDMFGGSVRAAGNYWRWTLRGEAARGLVEKIDARSHCSAKRDRMITNFGAPTYSEQNREKKREYDKKYQETTRERQKEYHRERYRRLSNEAKLLREVQSASSVD